MHSAIVLLCIAGPQQNFLLEQTLKKLRPIKAQKKLRDYRPERERANAVQSLPMRLSLAFSRRT